MDLNRRNFMQLLGAGACCGAVGKAEASSEKHSSAAKDGMGMLVDTTECIGCRKCEWACNEENDLTDKPLEAFEDERVFEKERRMTHDAFTVVNRYPNPHDAEKPIFAKIQCMHCLEPACVSACLVGALTLEDNGAVIYDAHKCMGCRYCMAACPFQVPAYEYHKPLTPRVRKCILCFERIAKNQAGEEEAAAVDDMPQTTGHNIPACANMCPPQAITYGKREDLLNLAHAKIAESPDRYVNKVYGEDIVGGTSWLYLSSVPFKQLGFLKLDNKPIPPITESIQHSILRYGVPPLLGFAILGAAMKVFHDDNFVEDHPEIYGTEEGEKK